MKFWGGLFTLILFAQYSFAVCSHESITKNVYSKNQIEILLDQKLSSISLKPKDIENIELSTTSVSKLFPSVQHINISIVILTSESFQLSYPHLTMQRWGYFNHNLNSTCGKKMIFLRAEGSATSEPQLPPSFLYNYIHELTHLFRYEIDPDNFYNNLWAEEGLADYIAFKATYVPPIKFLSKYLRQEKPLSFFSSPSDFTEDTSYYGQSFLFFDFLTRRLIGESSLISILNLKNPTLESYFALTNTSSYPSRIYDLDGTSKYAAPTNIYFNFKNHYRDITPAQNLYVEFVIKLLMPELNAFYDSTYKKNLSPHAGILPKNYSFAYIQLNHQMEKYSPALEADGIKSFVIFYENSNATRPYSVLTYKDFFNYISSPTKKKFVQSAYLVLINLSDKDMPYSFKE